MCGCIKKWYINTIAKWMRGLCRVHIGERCILLTKNINLLTLKRLN